MAETYLVLSRMALLPRPSTVSLRWDSQTPYAARFTNKDAAEAVAHVRNATVITIRSESAVELQAHDWWRRDDQGNPMPFEFRELPAPTFVAPRVRLEEAAHA